MIVGEPPMILRVGERPPKDKRYATDEYLYVGPGSTVVVAPRRKGEKPTMENAIRAIREQVAKSLRGAQRGLIAISDPVDLLVQDVFNRMQKGNVTAVDALHLVRAAQGLESQGQRERAESLRRLATDVQRVVVGLPPQHTPPPSRPSPEQLQALERMLSAQVSARQAAPPAPAQTQSAPQPELVRQLLERSTQLRPGGIPPMYPITPEVRAQILGALQPAPPAPSPPAAGLARSPSAPVPLPVWPVTGPTQPPSPSQEEAIRRLAADVAKRMYSGNVTAVDALHLMRAAQQIEAAGDRERAEALGRMAQDVLRTVVRLPPSSPPLPPEIVDTLEQIRRLSPPASIQEAPYMPVIWSGGPANRPPPPTTPFPQEPPYMPVIGPEGPISRPLSRAAPPSSAPATPLERVRAMLEQRLQRLMQMHEALWNAWRVPPTERGRYAREVLQPLVPSAERAALERADRLLSGAIARGAGASPPVSPIAVPLQAPPAQTRSGAPTPSQPAAQPPAFSGLPRSLRALNAPGSSIVSASRQQALKALKPPGAQWGAVVGSDIMGGYLESLGNLARIMGVELPTVQTNIMRQLGYVVPEAIGITDPAQFRSTLERAIREGKVFPTLEREQAEAERAYRQAALELQRQEAEWMREFRLANLLAQREAAMLQAEAERLRAQAEVDAARAMAEGNVRAAQEQAAAARYAAEVAAAARRYEADLQHQYQMGVLGVQREELGLRRWIAEMERELRQRELETERMLRERQLQLEAERLAAERAWREAQLLATRATRGLMGPQGLPGFGTPGSPPQ